MQEDNEILNLNLNDEGYDINEKGIKYFNQLCDKCGGYGRECTCGKLLVDPIIVMDNECKGLDVVEVEEKTGLTHEKLKEKAFSRQNVPFMMHLFPYMMAAQMYNKQDSLFDLPKLGSGGSKSERTYGSKVAGCISTDSWKQFNKEHPELKKLGRNDPCPCGSGKKYKKCCINIKYFKRKK